MNDILKVLKGIKPASWLKSALYGVLIVMTYNTALGHLILHDWAREDYSHSYLVPIIILYIVWEKREELASIPSAPSWIGFIPLVLGIFLFWLGELGGEFYTLYISLWFVLIGLLWLHLGWKKIKFISFPLFMVLTLFPFPNFINTRVLLNLRLISSQLGVALLQMLGMSAYREGNVIDLGFTQLQVVDACSGLRYVIPLVVLSILLAYWFKASLWKKAVLIFSSIPLAIAVNGLRIAVTGILYSEWGAEVAEGFLHGFSGWLIFMFTLPVMLFEMWLLKKIGRSAPGEAFKTAEKDISHQNIDTIKDNLSMKALLQPVFIVAVVLMAATFALSHGVEFREKVPIKKSFDQFPMTVGEWTGTRQTMEQQFIDALHFSDYIMVNYQNPKGQQVNFYVAYYESQRKGETTHSPETCLPGNGWIFERSDITPVDIGKGQPMRVNRTSIVKGDSRQLVYFWFPQRGRILTNLYQVKLYSFWDALIKKRTDGALVRVITPLAEGENLEKAEKRLTGFVKLINPMIEQFIPQ